MNNCIFCDKELELVQNNKYQPYSGGHIKFIFSYGSCEFDECPGTTEFNGLICDKCGLKYTKKMTKVLNTPNSLSPTEIKKFIKTAYIGGLE